MQKVCNTKDRVLSKYGNFVICYTDSAAHMDVPNEVHELYQYESEMVILFLSMAFLDVTYTYHIEIFAVNIVCDLQYKGFADFKFAVYWFFSRQVEMESK